MKGKLLFTAEIHSPVLLPILFLNPWRSLFIAGHSLQGTYRRVLTIGCSPQGVLLKVYTAGHLLQRHLQAKYGVGKSRLNTQM